MSRKVWCLILILSLIAAGCSIGNVESKLAGGLDESADEQLGEGDDAANEVDEVYGVGEAEESSAPPAQQPQTTSVPPTAVDMPDTGGGGGPGSTTPTALPTAASQQATGEAGGGEYAPPPTPAPEDIFFETHGVNPIYDTDDDHLSTFAMDVDTASYTMARTSLMDYQVFPDISAIRSEEFINYFDVDYPNPTDPNAAFAIHLDAAPAPFGAADHYLLRVGLQGRYVAPEDRDAALLIFVVDVSGSMDMENRLGLVKEALAVLVGELREDDRVGIVVYSDHSRALLEPTPASEADDIMQAINALHPEGSTNAAEGLQLGYRMAETHQREGTITRVILLSDGVANTGPEIEASGILGLVQESVGEDITLSTLGFGMDQYNDLLMEQLADDGNGNYYYVDTLREARRIFVHNLASTLQVIAYDAKVQVDFNPDVTESYRLIGYENRAVADESFRDDTVDAGEVGVGHSVTALYEIALKGDNEDAGTVATVYVRYQDADTREVVELSNSIAAADLFPDIDDAPADFRLLAATAEFSELLRGSYWAEDGSYAALLNFASPLAAEMPDNAEVAELVVLIGMAKGYVEQ